MDELKTAGTTMGRIEQMIPFEDFNQLIGLPEYVRLEERYRVLTRLGHDQQHQPRIREVQDEPLASTSAWHGLGRCHVPCVLQLCATARRRLRSIPPAR